MKHIDLNNIIKASADTKELDTNLISDGYHTFGELYDHRVALFITLCKFLVAHTPYKVWRSKLHHDGKGFEGWFIMGISGLGDQENLPMDHQITYHLPMSKWEDAEFATTLSHAPEWDGHSPADVLARLSKL